MNAIIRAILTRKTGWVLFTVILLSACSNRELKSTEPVLLTESEVRSFIEAYDKAWGNRDTTTMKEMMDEKYIYFTSTGSTSRRDNIIGWFTPADKYKVDTAYRNEISITLNENVAVINSHWVGSGTFGTEKFNDDQRCGLVVQKVNGKIKIVTEHCVQITK